MDRRTPRFFRRLDTAPQGTGPRPMTRLAATLCFGLAISGCAAVPQQRLQLYADTYGEMRQAAEAVYAGHAAMEAAARKVETESRLARASAEEYFDLIVPQSLTPPAADDPASRDIVVTGRAALDAGTLYNDALVALASGNGVEEVQASIDAITGTMAMLGGESWMASVATTVAGHVRTARTREDLIAALTRDITIEIDGDVMTGHPIDLLLDLLIEHAELIFAKRRIVEAQRAEDLEFEQRNPDAARVVANAMAAEAKVYLRYRQLLVTTKQYFAALRTAAIHPESELPAATTLHLGRDVYLKARQVIATIGGTPFAATR